MEHQEDKMSEAYWNSLYDSKDIGWDIGFPSPALKDYIDQLTDRQAAILIPGCGNAYEAEYLLKLGFSNITVIDIAPLLTAALQDKFKGNPHIKVITGDFFEHQGTYDLILEQTFLSALNPSVRTVYADKMHALLAKGGHLCGVLFGTVFEEKGPPFGGTQEEYKALFSEKFHIRKLESCYNSIERRKDNEVFINLIAK